MNRTLLVLAVLALLGGTFSGTAHASLIVNGSFEQPAIPGGSFAISPSIPGWTTTFGAGIEIQNNVAGTPFAGNQLVELDSAGNSGMVQNIPTAAGNIFQLSLAYSPRPGVGPLSNPIEVYWDGVLIDTLNGNGVGNPNTVWSISTYTLVATSSSTPLEFRATGTSDSLGGYLDAVSVQQIPEPVSLALFGLVGLASVGYGVWRKRRVR